MKTMLPVLSSLVHVPRKNVAMKCTIVILTNVKMEAHLITKIVSVRQDTMAVVVNKVIIILAISQQKRIGGTFFIKV